MKDINGRNRDYLLTAWYKHTFTFSADHTLGLTGGIIDATDYMNNNAYADDENTQFMNEILTNGPGAFLPSYDIGVAFEWAINDFSVTGTAMALGDNEEAEPNNEPYNFFGVQLGYTVNTVLGVGNYLVSIGTTSNSFPDPKGQKKDQRHGALISFDQQLGEILGAWIRFEWQNDETAVNFTDVYTGGIDINGNLWDRACDNIGIGYGHLRGGQPGFRPHGCIRDLRPVCCEQDLCCYRGCTVYEGLNENGKQPQGVDFWTSPDSGVLGGCPTLTSIHESATT